MQNLYSSLFLMVVGMGTVFLFLVLLNIATEIVHRMLGGPDAPAAAAPAKAAAPPSPAPHAQDEATLAAVIASAITQFRRDRDGS